MDSARKYTTCLLAYESIKVQKFDIALKGYAGYSGIQEKAGAVYMCTYFAKPHISCGIEN